MTPNEDEIYRLIASQLEGNISKAEESLLLEWIDSSEENQLLYVQASSIFHAQNGQLTKKSWDEIRPLLSKNRTRTRSLIYASLGAAASLALVVGLLLFNQKNEQHVIASTTSQTLIDTLPSGTTTELLPYSTLSTSTREAGDRESYALVGSGKFSIAENHPISIESNGLIIEDIGTSFLIDNSSADSTLIVVYDGIVRAALSENKKNEILANEGQCIVFHKSKKELRIVKSQLTRAELDLKRSFQFEDESVIEITKSLTSAFGRRFLVSENIAKCRVRVSFENENLATILEILAATLNLEIDQKNHYIELKGKSCE